MCAGVRLVALLFGFAGRAGAVGLAQPPESGSTQRPRPGLTAQQTKQAVELARGAMQELRKKTEGATEPEADRREYVVNVELLNAKDEEAAAPKESARENPPANSEGNARKPANPRAVVTSYRYFDDLTVFSTIDLGTGKVVEVAGRPAHPARRSRTANTRRPSTWLARRAMRSNGSTSGSASSSPSIRSSASSRSRTIRGAIASST